jgi:hypothetical protein
MPSPYAVTCRFGTTVLGRLPGPDVDLSEWALVEDPPPPDVVDLPS